MLNGLCALVASVFIVKSERYCSCWRSTHTCTCERATDTKEGYAVVVKRMYRYMD